MVRRGAGADGRVQLSRRLEGRAAAGLDAEARGVVVLNPLIREAEANRVALKVDPQHKEGKQ